MQGLIAESVHGAGGETVTAAFVRVLTALAGEWPSMFRPTAFDPSGVRVAAIDLAEVAPQGSAEAERQSAAFYLLARHALTQEWWRAPESLHHIPEPYRAWHRARQRVVMETPKRLAYDEFHRTAQAPAVRAQVTRDVREARKLRLRVVLASQRLEDFSDALIELANRYWILGTGGQAAEVERLTAMFGLNPTLADVVRHRLTGPGPQGAPALLIDAGGARRAGQLVVNTPGPAELWALTTRPADTALRRRLEARLGPARARAVLARAFPAGSAEDRLRAARDGGTVGDRDGEAAALDALADELAVLATAPDQTLRSDH